MLQDNRLLTAPLIKGAEDIALKKTKKLFTAPRTKSAEDKKTRSTQRKKARTKIKEFKNFGVDYHFLLERNFVTINEIRPAVADRPPRIIMIRFGLLTEFS